MSVFRDTAIWTDVSSVLVVAVGLVRAWGQRESSAGIENNVLRKDTMIIRVAWGQPNSGLEKHSVVATKVYGDHSVWPSADAAGSPRVRARDWCTPTKKATRKTRR